MNNILRMVGTNNPVVTIVVSTQTCGNFTFIVDDEGNGKVTVAQSGYTHNVTEYTFTDDVGHDWYLHQDEEDKPWYIMVREYVRVN